MSIPFLSCHSHFYGLHHLSCTDDYTCRCFWRNVLHYVDCRCRCHDGYGLQVLSRFVAVVCFGASVPSIYYSLSTICLFQMICRKRSKLGLCVEKGPSGSRLLRERTKQAIKCGGVILWVVLCVGVYVML